MKIIFMHGLRKYDNEMKNAFTNLLIIILCSAIGAAVLEFIVYPILFFFTHDCGEFFCDHEAEWSWSTYSICFLICFSVIGFFVLAAWAFDDTSKRGTTSKNVIRRQTRHYHNSVNRKKFTRRNNGYGVTDYYDEDVEGAPGYNGFD